MFRFSSFLRRWQRLGGRSWRTAPATRNQAQTAASGSLLPLREKARMRVTRASALRAGTPALPGARSGARVWQATAIRDARALPEARTRPQRSPLCDNLTRESRESPQFGKPPTTLYSLLSLPTTHCSLLSLLS